MLKAPNLLQISFFYPTFSRWLEVLLDDVAQKGKHSKKYHATPMHILYQPYYDLGFMSPAIHAYSLSVYNVSVFLNFTENAAN